MLAGAWPGFSLTHLGHGASSETVSLQSDDVGVAGSGSSDVHPVLGVGPSEGVLVEAGAAGQSLGDCWGPRRHGVLEHSLHPLEGLEVDEVPGGLLVLEVVGVLEAGPGQGGGLGHGVGGGHQLGQSVVGVVVVVGVG